MPRGAPVDSASARVVQAREDSVACFDSRRRRGPDRPESAGVLDHASYSDRPGLRRRVRLWASNDPNSHRERAKARPTQHAARLEKLERCDPDHHESYISWTDFERNQTLIADNANGKRFMSRGAIRRGEALLVGLFRCARCGRKLRVRYSDGAARYQCVGAFSHLAAARCINFGGMRADRMVAKERLTHLMTEQLPPSPFSRSQNAVASALDKPTMRRR